MLIVQLIESGSIVIITKFDFSQLFSCVHCVVGQSVTHVLVVVTLTLLFLLGFFLFVCFLAFESILYSFRIALFLFFLSCCTGGKKFFLQI